MKNNTSSVISIVATVYNSANIVELLVERIKNTINNLALNYEIILVDDGSTDDSSFIMEQLSNNDRRVKSIVLSRNFGQQIAMSAGIYHATGSYVVIMDGDLQNPPEAIPDLYRKIKEGYDIVYTTSLKKNNNIDSITSWLFWKFLKHILKVDIPESQLMLRMITQRVARYYCEFPEKIRTVAAITHDIGMKRTSIQVQNSKRIHGKSNYNTKKRVSLAIDVILELSNRPLNFIFYLGLIIMFISGIGMSYYLYVYMSTNILPGFTTMILLVMLFGSINLISMGILARYIANIYTEVKRRPLYFIQKTINIDN